MLRLPRRKNPFFLLFPEYKSLQKTVGMSPAFLPPGALAELIERKQNMKDRKSILWLLGELPILERDGLLDAESREKLEQFYRKRLDAAPARSWLLRSISIIGVLMISGGIVLLTAHNWDMLPKFWKIAISFTPFVLSGGFGILVLIKRMGQTAENAAAMLISASIAGLIALISQIYHINGSMFDYLTLVLGLSLPLMYVFRSVILGTLFPLFLLFYSAGLSRGDSAWIPFVYTLLWLPFAVRQFWKPDSIAAAAMRYVFPVWAAAMLVQYGISTKAESELLYELLCIGAAGFLNAGLILHDEKKGKFGNPWLIAGYGIIALLLVIWCCTGRLFRMPEIAHAGNFSLAVWGVFTAGALFPLLFRFSFEKLYIGLFALLPFAGDLLPPGKSDVLTPSLYLGGFGVFLIGYGFPRGDLVRLNLGLLALIALIVCRIFNENYSILTRAMVFLSLGVVFLLANGILHRYFRKHGTGEKGADHE